MGARIGRIDEGPTVSAPAPEVIALGEAVAEIMRPVAGIPLDLAGPFEGPFPSGAAAIFADACARLGLDTGFIGTVAAHLTQRQETRRAQRRFRQDPVAYLAQLEAGPLKLTLPE